MDAKALLAACDNVIPGHGDLPTIAGQLSETAAALTGDERPDAYGQGEYLQAFEAEVAAMFGKAAAVFMPSGTMAQQIALRVWCDRTGRPTVAMHPTAHLEFAEHLGYQYLTDLRRLQFGAPEFIASRMLTAADFERLGATPGAALLELPYRPLGGCLPEWIDLEGISAWAVDSQVPLHLDGARVWQCPHFYDRSLHDIGALFDSIYVSFYKDIGALGGCMLMGPEDFIAEARVWQRRYGGNLYSQAPLYASARTRLQQTMPQMESWVARARELAAVLSSHPKVRVHPDPPQVNFFRVYLDLVSDIDSLLERHHALAEETGTFLFAALTPASVPGFATTEVHCWENALAADLDRVEDFLDRLL